MPLTRLAVRPVVGLLVLLLSTVSTIRTSSAEEFTGSLLIVDGDTIVVGGRDVRIQGIDSAELGQRCVNSQRQFVRPGELAADRLRLLAEGSVTCNGRNYDDYGRLIAICKTKNGTDVGATLVREGLAWAFVKYSTEYVADETVARKNGIGVWQMKCQAPWEFRKARWAVAAQKAPDGCPIKGNISSNGHIYHTPWSRHYTATRVSVNRGERWFCNEKDAKDAGWRPPIR